MLIGPGAFFAILAMVVGITVFYFIKTRHIERMTMIQHVQQLSLQKNLTRAMIGVGLTLVLILMFLFGTGNFIAEPIAIEGFSSNVFQNVLIATLITMNKDRKTTPSAPTYTAKHPSTPLYLFH